MTLKLKQVSQYGPYDCNPPSPRWFGTGQEVGEELHCSFVCVCRETFLKSIKENKLTNQWIVYYAKSVKSAKCIKDFVEKAESKLIKEKYQRSQIHTVGMKVCILPAEFWKPKFRLGFLTILIRAGTKYDGSVKFFECLYASPYAKGEGMSEAIKLFFAGNTNYVSSKGNSLAGIGLWVDEFGLLTKKQVAERLEK